MSNVFLAPGSKLRLLNPLWWILFLLVKFYRLFSRYFPNRCRFVPSCSAYALDALSNFGALRASKLIMFRLSKCHPFHPGGFDYIDQKSDSKQDL